VGTNRFVDYQFLMGKSFGPHSIVHLLHSKPVTSEEMCGTDFVDWYSEKTRNEYVLGNQSTHVHTSIFTDNDRNRFFAMLKFWHISDPAASGQPQFDKMYSFSKKC